MTGEKLIIKKRSTTLIGFHAIPDTHKHGAEFADRNLPLDPTLAYLMGYCNQTARYPTSKGSFGVRGGHADRVCSVVSRTPIATIYSVRSIVGSVDRSK